MTTTTKKPVTVLHLIHTMAYGGVETALLNWLARIDKTKFTIHLACFANPHETETPFVEAAKVAGIEVIAKIPWGRHKPVIRSARRLKKLLIDLDVDILHTHNCYADCVGAIAQRLTPVKTLTTLYVWSDLGWKRNLIQSVNRFAIRGYDMISAHCEETYRQTLEMGFPAERLRTLICGFEIDIPEYTAEDRQSKRRELGLGDNDILLANIARFYPEKVQDSLLRCFKRIHQKHPDARMWMLGVGPLEAELKAYCTKLELDDTVSFVGFVEDLASMLPLIDIQVHPSQIEGVPLSICSGMAAGLPIVVSDVGGIPEILEHQKRALLTPRSDEDAFVDAVNYFIENPEYAKQMGNAAKHFIENDYSLNTAVSHLEACYHEVMTL
ncbi:MAG: glycosyltransferase [Gammaproteobacteria bacterium]